MPKVKSPSGLEDWEYYFGPFGEIRWNSNDAVLDPKTCKELKIEAPANQPVEYDKYLNSSLAAYRKSMENHVYSEEELFEMRAAFGSGTEVVNVLTGKKIKL